MADHLDSESIVEEEASVLLEVLRSESGHSGPELDASLYRELRSIARRIAPGGTLGPTALINEAYLRFARERAQPQNRQHLICTLARAMRRTALDYYRSRALRPLPLEEPELLPAAAGFPRNANEALALAECMEELMQLDREQARVAELRLYGGLEIAATAEALEVSTATVERRWRAARAFLTMRLA